MVKNITMVAVLYIKKAANQARRIKEIYKLNTLKKSYTLNQNVNSAIKELESYREKQPIMMGEALKQKRECILSIIIPVYNAEKYISSCIDSILKQKIKCSYEIICVNDGSTDASLEMLQKYELPEMKIITQMNAGAATARNRGLAESRGEYILFIDSDDIVPYNAINKMINGAEKTDADIVMGSVGKCDSKMKNIYFPKEKGDILTRDYRMACNLVAGTPWGKLYKFQLWENVRFFENYAYEDTIIFLNIFPQAKSFYMLGTPVYCFRSNNSSLFKRENESIRRLDILWVIVGALNKSSFLNNKVDPAYYQVLIWHLSVLMYARLETINDGKILQDAFVVAANIITRYVEKYGECSGFVGKNSNIYYRVQESFISKDYLLWLYCCKALKNSGEI